MLVNVHAESLGIVPDPIQMRYNHTEGVVMMGERVGKGAGRFREERAESGSEAKRDGAPLASAGILTVHVAPASSDAEAVHCERVLIVSRYGTCRDLITAGK